MLSKKIKKKGLHKNFSGDLQKKNVFQTNFQALYKILTIQKIVPKISESFEVDNFVGNSLVINYKIHLCTNRQLGYPK